jgi:hypothetical protein
VYRADGWAERGGHLANNPGADVGVRFQAGNGTVTHGVNGGANNYARPPGVMPQAMGHAETNAMLAAKSQGATGGVATLFTTKVPCSWCRSSLRNLSKHLDLDELHVYGPGGYYGRYVRGGGYRTINKGSEW